MLLHLGRTPFRRNGKLDWVRGMIYAPPTTPANYYAQPLEVAGSIQQISLHPLTSIRKKGY